ncbi:orotidine-5'-phosphate decarboxylase [Mariniblastus fucicola]|uniref:Orotidine 5'-phosphate decarboxylase n=1 Tax=Mariniblastus fucicola TaxID=980251 RepID=A0A5B9PAN5_9BACT|nr:orotidine-5'-phosphate decarboxylase [Mariniblastus fucicola]QEG23324.1 Orotidine 5'-phosphate decarboxylase [Mariniblastus fucicola]
MKNSPEHFGDRLTAAIKNKKTPLVVGLDPRWDNLPDDIKSIGNQAEAFEVFCKAIIDVVADKVPAVKPQSAFFEQLGPAGVVALGRVTEYAREKGLLTIMDAKRGDIGSTATAYAKAYLDRSENGPWQCDSLTVNPYLGDDSLTPFCDVAMENGAGIFVLAKTSNPGSKTFQEKTIGADGGKLFELVADHLQMLAARNIGDSGFGFVGAVVGATWPEELVALRKRMPNVIFLIPGFGAQGGSAADIAGGLNEHGLGGVINSSRGIIFAYERPEFEAIVNWQDAVSLAADMAIGQIAADSNAGKLRL